MPPAIEPRAIQDDYPEEYSHCYGCGRFNEHGLQIKSYWADGEAVCTYTPEPYHLGIAGYVYGGLIASLIDCHCIAAAAAAYDAEMRSEAPQRTVRTRFVTAALHVDYLRPTPLGVPVEIRARPTEIGGRKVVLAATLSAEGVVCARGQVVAVRLPDEMKVGKD
jgi:acyl-coenzyme A thioesterase PaaI-like protein